MRKLRGLEIKQHIPDCLLEKIVQSVKEAGYEWNDEFIKDCCLTAPPANYFYCQYDCHTIFPQHKGFLFGFGKKPCGEYLFTWSKPFLHRKD